ncbi:hypothetical protein [Xylanimonas protaetiae]|uniref:DUF3854 domain-containing protein n=1 Tax=Xylanimonas protaetiae TaxID=2509457 RepID=A0A4P6FIJ9_9MICO|nr:hypothetical protein [Xylanimonas protaetiae]QAY70388.1 hypothetical protein ET471_10385 [Xylanimonas protaetiae]
MSDYHCVGSTSSGAAKLRDSAVAPLVAAARGYATFLNDKADLKRAKDILGVTSMASGNGRILRECVSTGDTLLMPWFDANTTWRHAHENEIARRGVAHQLRPSAPVRFPGDKKERKYVNLKDQGTRIDLHPATPLSWLNSGPDQPQTIVIAEGLIKGDSALTAVLRAAGVSDEDLMEPGEGADPAARLRQVMEAIPADKRFLILSVVGVGNWHKNSEWNTIAPVGRDCWVTFDADLATNHQVWSQAAQMQDFLEAKGAKDVFFVDLSAAGATGAKDGLDDFLAQAGVWGDIGANLVDLPEAPLRLDDDGLSDPMVRFRVSPDGSATQRKVATPDGGSYWQDLLPFGGRIAFYETVRSPRQSEMASGVAETTPSPDDETRATIEVAYGCDGEVRTAVVRGRQRVVDALPAEWWREGASIPRTLSAVSGWPPRRQDGEAFLEAMKGNGAPDDRVLWDVMGWMPSPPDGSGPVYVVGDCVIGKDGQVSTDDVRVENPLPIAENFGVVFPDPDVDWVEQALIDAREVIDVYLHSGAWTDPSIAHTVLALALRPALPLLPRAAAYLVGGPGSGKSFTAGHIMSFWQCGPDRWNENSLTGTADDTVASSEINRHHSNIWVVDDLAPSPSKQTSERQQAAVGSMIRSNFNRRSRSRATAEMGLRRARPPRALLIVTAENEPSVSSIADRVITLRFGKGALAPTTEPTDRLRVLQRENPAPARLMGALLRWLATGVAEPGKWLDLNADLIGARNGLESACAKWIESLSGGPDAAKGSPARQAKIAADLLLGLWVFREFLDFLGVLDEPLFEAFSKTNNDMVLREAGWFDADGKPVPDGDPTGEFRPTLYAYSAYEPVVRQVMSTYSERASRSIGASILEAVRSTLESGKGYLSVPESPDASPADVFGRKGLNARIGWRGESPAPGATHIGAITKINDARSPHNGELVVLLNPSDAYCAASRNREDVLPHGTRAAQVWEAVWDEGRALPENQGWKRNTDSRGRKRAYVRARLGGEVIKGVPVLLDVLLNGEEADRA